MTGSFLKILGGLLKILMHYTKQDYKLTTWCSKQTLQRISFFSKYHKVSRYVHQCNFIFIWCLLDRASLR